MRVGKAVRTAIWVLYRIANPRLLSSFFIWPDNWFIVSRKHISAKDQSKRSFLKKNNLRSIKDLFSNIRHCLRICNPPLGRAQTWFFLLFFLRNVLQMKKISIYSFCPPISFRWTGREALTGRRVGCGAPERSVGGDLLRYRSRYWSFRPPVLLFLKGVKENNCFSEYIGGCPESAG